MSPQPGNHRSRIVDRKPAELERMRQCYVANELSLTEICRRFRSSDHELRVLANRHGWPMRGKSSKPKALTLKKPPRRTEAQIRQQNLDETQARETALYGSDMADVRYLQHLGYIIDRHGISLASRGVRVGNKIITFAQLREMAERERRLAAPMVVAVAQARKGR